MNEIIEPDFRIGLCAVCGKKPTTQFCDYIMEYHFNTVFVRNSKVFNEINRRGAQYETCDLPMCKDCAEEISNDHDFCPHHYDLHLQRGLPDKFQRKRQSHARGYLASQEIQATLRDKGGTK
jgi:hypothetical protein